MVAVKDALEVLLLQLLDLEDWQAASALSRLATMRTAAGFDLDPWITDNLDATLKALKQVQVDALVVELALKRPWKQALPSVGLELAVRAHLERQEFGYSVEEAGAAYMVALWKGGKRREAKTQAPWYGLLALWRRWT